MSNTLKDFEKEAELRRLGDETLYKSIRQKGHSHEEALKLMYEAKLLAEQEQKKVLKEIQEEKMQQTLKHFESEEIQSLTSYYLGKAFKHLVLFLILAIPVYFTITSEKGTVGLTLENILSATGAVSVIAIILLFLILGIVIFRNYIIGPIVGILALAFLIDKLAELQKKYNISDETLENGLILIGTSYLLINLFLVIRNIVKIFKH